MNPDDGNTSSTANQNLAPGKRIADGRSRASRASRRGEGGAFRHAGTNYPHPSSMGEGYTPAKKPNSLNDE